MEVTFAFINEASEVPADTLPRRRGDEARFSAVIEAVSAVMMKVAYEALVCIGDPAYKNRQQKSAATRLLDDLTGANKREPVGVGPVSVDAAINKGKEHRQVGIDQINSALATIKASAHHAIIMKRVHDRIVAEQETKPNRDAGRAQCHQVATTQTRHPQASMT